MKRLLIGLSLAAVVTLFASAALADSSARRGSGHGSGHGSGDVTLVRHHGHHGSHGHHGRHRSSRHGYHGYYRPPVIITPYHVPHQGLRYHSYYGGYGYPSRGYGYRYPSYGYGSQYQFHYSRPGGISMSFGF